MRGGLRGGLRGGMEQTHTVHSAQCTVIEQQDSRTCVFIRGVCQEDLRVVTEGCFINLFRRFAHDPAYIRKWVLLLCTHLLCVCV
jgi:hypothetical protein